jgi:hypothetical protein
MENVKARKSTRKDPDRFLSIGFDFGAVFRKRLNFGKKAPTLHGRFSFDLLPNVHGCAV